MPRCRRPRERTSATRRALAGLALTTLILATPIASGQAIAPWPAAGIEVLAGEVILDEALVFAEDVLVRVLPGTRVVAAQNASTDATPSLIVHGALEAVGLPDAPIRLGVPLIIRSGSSIGSVVQHAAFQGDDRVECLLTLETPSASVRHARLAGGRTGICVDGPGVPAGHAHRWVEGARLAPSQSAPAQWPLLTPAPEAAPAPAAPRAVHPLWPAPLPPSPGPSTTHPAGLLFDDVHVGGAATGIHLRPGAPEVLLSNSTLEDNLVGLRVDGGRARLDHATLTDNRAWDIQAASVQSVDWSGSHVEVSCVSVAGLDVRDCERGSIGLTPLLLLLGILYLLSEAGRYVLTRFAIWAKLYSRIAKRELLNEPARQRLVELVAATPGIHLRALVNEVGGYGRTTYHLHRLEEVGFIVSKRDGLHRRFYVPADARDVRRRLSNRERVLGAIADRPGIHPGAVARALGLSRQLAAYHANKLAAAGLIIKETAGRRLSLRMREPAGPGATRLGTASPREIEQAPGRERKDRPEGDAS